jgi:hypothetical protein
MLTIEEILLLLDGLAWRTVWTDDRRIRLQELVAGYSAEPEIARLQTKLSIMLEAAAKRGREPGG